METIKVALIGTSSLLMHKRPPINQGKKIHDPTTKYIPEIEAKKALYEKNGKPYFPSSWIRGLLDSASKNVKKGKANLRTLFNQGISVVPPEIFLKGNPKYKIDSQWVKIQYNMIVRTRPRFDKWQAEFSIIYEEELVDYDDIEKILNRGGHFIGLGDNRKNGYGRFKIIKFEKGSLLR